MWYGIALLAIVVILATHHPPFFSFVYFGIQMLRRFRTRGKRIVYNLVHTTVLLGYRPLLIAGVSELVMMPLKTADSLGPRPSNRFGYRHYLAGTLGSKSQ